FYYIHSKHITPCFIFVDDVLSYLQRLNNQHLPAVSWSCFVSEQIIYRISSTLPKGQCRERSVQPPPGQPGKGTHKESNQHHHIDGRGRSPQKKDFI
ncbi:hypothetical protein, partial [Escherichia coli]|uniref:hypothetical protein n=1 Tax=Escherichia coli TaxID=562 RepID=UPI001BAEF261